MVKINQGEVLAVKIKQWEVLTVRSTQGEWSDSKENAGKAGAVRSQSNGAKRLGRSNRANAPSDRAVQHRSNGTKVIKVWIKRKA